MQKGLGAGNVTSMTVHPTRIPASMIEGSRGGDATQTEQDRLHNGDVVQGNEPPKLRRQGLREGGGLNASGLVRGRQGPSGGTD